LDMETYSEHCSLSALPSLTTH